VSAFKKPIHQKRPNFRIPYFRPSMCRTLHSAARGACPHRPLPPPLNLGEGDTSILDIHYRISLVSKRDRFWSSSVQWAPRVADKRKKKKEDVTGVKPTVDVDYVGRSRNGKKTDKYLMMLFNSNKNLKPSVE